MQTVTVQDILAKLPALNNRDYFLALDELQRLLLAQQTDVLTDDDIEQLSKIDIDDTQDMGQGARKRTAKDWLKDHLLGKTVRTIDGKIVHFNSEDTVGHISFNVRRNATLVQCMPFIPQVFAKGEFVGREHSEHTRADDSIIAFHLYQKWIKLKNGYQVYAQVQACERKNQQGLFYAGYNLKALDKKRTIFDNMVLGVATPSHQNGNSDSTTLANAQATTTLGKKSTTQFDKLQDDTSNHVLPLLILMVKDEAGKVVYDLEKGIDDLAEGWELQATQTPIFNRQGVKPTNRNGNVDMRARQKANDEAIALLNKIQNEGLTRDDLTTEQLTTLAKYTGNGGGVVNHEGKTGSQYEYYTPLELASGMWDLARELGFNGGKVLDPSAGTGIFTATSPNDAVVDSIELDPVSGGIAQVLNDGDRSHTVISPFEKQASRIEDDSVDLVITNVPFGDNKSRGANKSFDKAYQNESLQNYFILRSLEKLKHGGLAVFVTPTSVVSGKKQSEIKLRQKASLKAEFLGAYRLPNQMFDETGADVVTDVIAFRKFSAESTQIIKDLYDGGNLDALTQANVLYDNFLNGNYFLHDGRRFVLGDEVQVQVDGRYYDEDGTKKQVTKIVSPKSNAEIAKMLQKFGDSRINWDLLNTTEPNVITYNNGDMVFQNGRQLQYQDGVWQAIEREATDTDRAMQDLLAKLDNGYSAAIHGVTWDDITSLRQYIADTNQRGLLPSNILDLADKAQKSQNPKVAWQVLIVAAAIERAIEQHGYDFDFVTGEPILTASLKTAFLDGKNSSLTGDVKQAHKLVAMHYNNGEYSNVWRGEVSVHIDDVELVDYKDKIAQLQYQNKSLYVTSEQFAQVYPDTDPLQDDNWFINAEGKVIAADDFLVGKLADRLKDIDNEIAKTTDDAIKAKLIKQKILARGAIIKTDVRNINYSLRSPLISAEIKVTFLQQQKDIGRAAKIVFDEAGRAIPDIDFITPKTDTEKLLKRMGDWLAKGTVTLGRTKLKDFTEKEALEWLSDRINRANIEFDTWLKANDAIMESLNARINSDESLYFAQNGDERPVEIAGMNPSLKLHGYQNAFVRNQGRQFGGINGFGVGLGKTFSALASVQHVQNIGAKKKTIFVVPNSVLSNWRKEAKHAYTDMNDCIFIGLREKGDGFRVQSNLYDEDLTQAVDKKYRKIFMTYEAFKRIRLKQETLEGYADYLRANDSSYEASQNKKKDEASNSNVSDEIEKLYINSNAPYLEDMNIDSIVIDEAHAYKNSINAHETDKQIKYLPLAKTSARGDDAQAKMWYIRGLTANKDGVQLLTATPITNSPLEIYSMLALTAGREKVNAMCGDIRGADDFLKIICNIAEETVPTIDGRTRSQNVFMGIQNGKMLSNAITQVATIKDAKDVGLSVVIPERNEIASKVTLSEHTMSELVKLQKAYRVAKSFAKNQDLPEIAFNPTLMEAYSEMMAKYGETDELMGHPFNLIHKMDVMIADEEFSSYATFYDFDPNQRDIAERSCEQFNKRALKDDVARLSEFTHSDNAAAIYKKEDGEQVLKGYKVTTTAKVIFHQGRDRIVIDTLDSKIQLAFEKIADKNELALNVTVPAKLAALLDNFKQEMANPRGIKGDGANSHLVKQIIFCDHLFLHNKIKRLLSQQTGIPANKIVVITGQINNEPDEIIDIQDGFNAFDDDNQYQVVIANQKAEVGINLQHGTQAIHHLTTGWTPDSLEQRNGRGARQGNLTDTVHIYHYDADGTFDEFKRTMINKKDEWISDVLSSEGKNKIDISGSISQEEQEALIQTMGDANAIAEYLANKDELEKRLRIAKAEQYQSVNLDIIQTQSAILKYSRPDVYYNIDVKNVINAIRGNAENEAKAQDAKATQATRDKWAGVYEATKQSIIANLQTIIDSVAYQKYSWANGEKEAEAVGEPISINHTAERLYERLATKDNRKKFKPSDAHGGTWIRIFESLVLYDHPDYSYRYRDERYETVIKSNSVYQAEYDNAVSTAKNLIRVAKKTVNDVGKEYGGMILPDDADQKIIEGTASFKNGVYAEVGALVFGADNGEYGVINHDLTVTYTIDRREERFWESDLNLAKAERRVILPTDPDYLDGVKKLAKIEDEFYAKGLISDGKLGEFSKIVPIIADYRDETVMPTYDIKQALFNTAHHRLLNAPFPFIVPVSMLQDTEFGRKIAQCYKDIGINIDKDRSEFSVVKGSEVIVKLHDITGSDKEFIANALADFIKGHQVKLEAADTDLEDIYIYRQIVKQPESFDKTALEAAKQLASDYTDDDIITLSNNLYNDYIKADNDLIPQVSDKMKDDLLHMAINPNALLSNNPNTFTFREAIAQFLKKRNNDRAQGVDSLNDALELTDFVSITGDTYDNHKLIKAYAEKFAKKYGLEPLKKGKNRYGRAYESYAEYNGANQSWKTFYGAWLALLEDYPNLNQVLFIKKAN